MSRSRRKREAMQQGMTGPDAMKKALQDLGLGQLTSPLHYAAVETEELELSTAVQAQLINDKPGLVLWKALQESTFLYKAARRYTDTAMLVSDGRRFWTSSLNFEGMYTEELKLPLLPEQELWRPIIGNETGWRLA